MERFGGIRNHRNFMAEWKMVKTLKCKCGNTYTSSRDYEKHQSKCKTVVKIIKPKIDKKDDIKGEKDENKICK